MTIVPRTAAIAALLALPALAAAVQAPDLPAARRQIRDLLVAGQGERALAAIEPLLAAHGDDAGLHALRGEALFELERHDESAARLVKLRYFAGLSHQEAAEAMQITRRAADRLWALARAWLFQRLRESS